MRGDNYIERIYSFPSEGQRLGDLELGVLFNGVWQVRRFVYTPEIVAFARPGEEFLLDAIPMEEIMGLELIDGMGLASGSINPGDPYKHANEEQYENAFQIRTSKNGYNSGRKYCLQASSQHQCKQILEDISKLVQAALERDDGKSTLQKARGKVQRFLDLPTVRMARTWIILTNLVLVAAEVNLKSSASKEGLNDQTQRILEYFNLFFTIMFTIELLFNLFASWFLPFITDFWAVFDLAIVTLSLIALSEHSIPANVVRSLRVLRLLSNIKALEKIIAAVSNSIIPMANAFMIVFAFAFLYSIIGVYFFQDLAPDLFGGLGAGFVTMFRITSGEGQFFFENMPSVDSEGVVNTGTVMFAGSYIIVVIWIFLQVSVAVLLDNFIQASARREALARAKEIEEAKNVEEIRSPLESLLVKLVKGYTDDTDLSNRLRALYKILDSDGSGSLSSEEFCAAMKRLDLVPRIHMSESDFDFITQNRALCDEFGGVGVGEFEQVMIAQIRQYTQSRLSDGAFSEHVTKGDANFNQLGCVKMILMELLRMDRDQKELQRDVRQLLSRFSSSLDSDSLPMGNLVASNLQGRTRMGEPPKKEVVIEPNGTLLGAEETVGMLETMTRVPSGDHATSIGSAFELKDPEHDQGAKSLLGFNDPISPSEPSLREECIFQLDDVRKPSTASGKKERRARGMSYKEHRAVAEEIKAKETWRKQVHKLEVPSQWLAISPLAKWHTSSSSTKAASPHIHTTLSREFASRVSQGSGAVSVSATLETIEQRSPHTYHQSDSAQGISRHVDQARRLLHHHPTSHPSHYPPESPWQPLKSSAFVANVDKT